MNNQNEIINCLTVFLALLLFGNNAVYASTAGHVQFVNGEVQLTTAAGQTSSLQKGDAVSEGDTLTSTKDASAQIKMEDGGLVAIRPDTRMKFDQFVFSGKQDGRERGFFSLFKGGFRAVTGLIGKINKQNYRITTSNATLGIRGTDHEIFVVTPDSGIKAEVGTYNKVNVGETTLTTNKGTINILPNQMGFAGGMDQLPKLQPINTNIFTVVAEPNSQGKGEKQDDKNQGQDANSASVNMLFANSAQLFAPVGAIPNLGAIAMPSQGQGAIAYFDGFGSFVTSDMMTFSSDRLGQQLNGVATPTLSAARGSALVVDNGYAFLNGTEMISWGRWEDPPGVTSITVTPVGSAPVPAFNLHYAGGNLVGLMPITNPVTGGATATYNLVGGTSPTDSAGNVGQFNGTTVGVNFATKQVDVTMAMTFATISYTATGSTGPGGYLTNGVIPKTTFTTVTDSLNTGTATGEFTGSFVGTNAAGLGLVYHINHGAVDIVGAQGFIRQ